ncbi:hypothetical protein [Halomonas sp. BM-2019]|uniref:hypothetical protein n=1 Tax=Halomonas sp. BM-2019 TaxID=2811227 RepID=UPI001B3C36CC|nr:MAG: hypothetical protein J5F18_05940 [Halomonas sp. BM-2019]
MSESQVKDTWDKLAVLSGFLAAVFVPLALGLAGHWYTDAIRDRETSLKEREFAREWVQLSLEVLREETAEENTVLREWAVDVLNHYSDVEIRIVEELREALVEGRARFPDSPLHVSVPVDVSRFSRMIQLQEFALDALLQRDVDTAMHHLGQAHELWHDFRTIWEVLSLLRRTRGDLDREDDAAWTGLYSSLQNQWDLRDIDPRLREQLKQRAEN